MHQLEIEYFFPLTEQIPLDLDFKPSTDYEDEKRAVRYWANSTALNDDINTNYIIKIGNTHRVGGQPDTTFTCKFVIDVDNRDIVQRNLTIKKIETKIHYERPIHEMDVFLVTLAVRKVVGLGDGVAGLSVRGVEADQRLRSPVESTFA